MMTAEVEMMRAAVEENPMDVLSRLAYADALEESGKAMAAFYEREIVRMLRDGVKLGRRGKELVKAIRKAVGCTSRRVKVVIATEARAYDVHFGGGTRNRFSRHTLDGRSYQHLHASYGPVGPRRDVLREHEVDVSEGMRLEVGSLLLVVHSMFCGRDMGITIYVHPSRAGHLEG